jgi:hypothetical protein
MFWRTAPDTFGAADREFRLTFLEATRGVITSCTARATERTSKIKKNAARWMKHPPHLTEHRHHLLDIFLYRGLKANLAGDAIIPKTPFTSMAERSQHSEHSHPPYL